MSPKLDQGNDHHFIIELYIQKHFSPINTYYEDPYVHDRIVLLAVSPDLIILLAVSSDLLVSTDVS